jgi:TPR repeat protein
MTLFPSLNKRLINKLSLSFVFVFSFSTFATTLSQADSYYDKQQYDLALNEYLKAAADNEGKAFYQLGVIYYRGLGVKADSIKALVWFSLAAKYNFGDAKDVVENLFKHANEADKNKLNRQVNIVKNKLKKNALYLDYMPEINVLTLNSKVRFGDEDELDPADLLKERESFGINMFGVDNNASASISSDGAYGAPSAGVDVNSGILNVGAASSFYLIAEYDIAPDGSIRNVIAKDSTGNEESDHALYDLRRSNIENPTLLENQAHFAGISYRGIASFNKYRMKKRFSYLYKTVRRQRTALQESDDPIDSYKYAMLLQKFPWLAYNNEQAMETLKQAAEYGYALAEYQYGLKLYQQQTDPKQAIFWIAQAAKDGVQQAQYRLGDLLKNSPWIIQDEKKAIFWFDEAARQGHVIAKQKAAEIKILTDNEQLKDIAGGALSLAEIEQQQKEDPQYHYLQAMAHAQMQNRDLSKAVKYIRRAISYGKSLNWDVSGWKEQLKNWTSGGSVTIQDE